MHVQKKKKGEINNWFYVFETPHSGREDKHYRNFNPDFCEAALCIKL